MRWGIRAIVGQSFAEIFHGNCLALGIPCSTLRKHEIEWIQKLIKNNPNEEWEINLEEKKIIREKSEHWDLNFEPGALKRLTTGQWDATSQLISHKEQLTHIQNSLPYINEFN